MRAGREDLWTRRRAGTVGVLVRLSVLGALILSACGGSSEESASEPTLIATTTEQVTTTTVHPDDRAIDRGFVAMCNDGNYSDNLDFRATCSGGDGIDYWLSAFGRCADGSIVVMETRPSCGRDGFDRLMPRDFVPEQGPDDVAVCNDGNFSSNHNFAATCSGGDGVDYWLAPFGECSDGTAIKLSSTASCPSGTSFVGLLPADFVPPTTTTIADATPADIEVPDVIGLRLDSAISQLTDLGLGHVASDAIESRSIFARSNWVVVEQVPEPGASVTADATIELGVARPEEAQTESTDGLSAQALEEAMAAAWGRASLIETCQDGSSFCFVANIEIRTGGVAIITAQISDRDEAFGQDLASNVFSLVGLQFPDLKQVQVINAVGNSLAIVQRSSVLGDQ